MKRCKTCNLYTQPSNLQLVEEEKLRGTPAQERERLLQQVKDDNAEISTMERQITEMQEKVRRTSYMYVQRSAGRVKIGYSDSLWVPKRIFRSLYYWSGLVYEIRLNPNLFHLIQQREMCRFSLLLLLTMLTADVLSLRSDKVTN